jgi:hypothetical protein
VTDNITLPRAVAEKLRELVTLHENIDWWWQDDDYAALAALDAALAEPPAKPEPESKTPAWWMDGLTVTLMREGVNKHRAREIAIGYWEAYCQMGNEEDKT